MVNAAAGGVGSLLIQSARAAGADHVIAAASSADIIYDLVGGATTKAALGALAPLGELAFAALGRFDLGPEELAGMLSRNQSLKGFALLPLLTQDNPRGDLANLFKRSASGELEVVHGGRYPLAQAADAHRVLESRQSDGKVVLVP